jgi:hypothetical protein
MNTSNSSSQRLQSASSTGSTPWNELSVFTNVNSEFGRNGMVVTRLNHSNG